MSEPTGKYSITMPRDIAEAAKARGGPSGLSAYVAAAVAQQIERDNLNELVQVAEAEHRPVTDEEILALHDQFHQARQEQTRDGANLAWPSPGLRPRVAQPRRPRRGWATLVLQIAMDTFATQLRRCSRRSSRRRPHRRGSGTGRSAVAPGSADRGCGSPHNSSGAVRGNDGDHYRGQAHAACVVRRTPAERREPAGRGVEREGS